MGFDSSLKNSADGFEQYYALREQRLNAIEGQAINLDFAYTKDSPDYISLEVSDSGDGFNPEKAQAALDRGEDLHGRGMHLLKRLCSSLEYSIGGRTANATYAMAFDEWLVFMRF